MRAAHTGTSGRGCIAGCLRVCARASGQIYAAPTAIAQLLFLTSDPARHRALDLADVTELWLLLEVGHRGGLGL